MTKTAVARNSRARKFRAAAASLAVAATALVFTSPTAHAAALTGSVTSGSAANGPQNLTTAGGLDWAVWNYTTNPINGGAKTIAPSNHKNVSDTVISSATTLLGGGRGTTNTPPTQTFSYSDGVSPVTLTSATQGELFDGTLGNTNSGFTFTITGGQAGVPEVAKIYLTGYDTTPTLTVSLPGATTYTDNSITYLATGRVPVIYTINFTPDNTGDLLTVTYKSTTVGTSGNANADLQAVAVSTAAVPAPEPASAALVTCAAFGFLTHRRRRK